jgi:hypothetical protein
MSLWYRIPYTPHPVPFSKIYATFVSNLLFMKEFIKKHHLVIILSLAGAIGGFLYWKLVGCKTGTCPIKSVWYLSTLWGTAFGYLAGSIINDLVKKFREKKNRPEDNSPNSNN